MKKTNEVQLRISKKSKELRDSNLPKEKNLLETGSPVLNDLVSEMKTEFRSFLRFFENLVNEVKCVKELLDYKEKTVFSIDEAAQYLKTSSNSIRYYVKKHELRPSLIGKKGNYIFTRTSLDEFVVNRQVKFHKVQIRRLK